MNTKTTAILLIVAIAIAGYIFFIDKNIPTSDEREAAGKKIFGFLKSEDIGQIEINAPNAAQLTLIGAGEPATPARIAIICRREKNGEWLMTQPVNTRAAKSFLDDIADEISGLEKRDTIKESDKATTFGLDYPIITVSFTAKSQNHLIKIGKPAPLDIGVYLAVDGRKDFYLVRKSFAELLNKPVADFRHKKIFDANAYDLARLELSYPDRTIELAKTGGDWRLAQPIADKADPSKVNELISQLSTLSINSFIADNETDLAIYGLNQPALKVIVADPNDPNKSETLLIGRERESGQLIAAKQGATTVFTIDKSAYDVLAMPLDALRAKKAFELSAADINLIEIKSGTKTALKLEKNSSDSNWEFVYPPMTITGQAPSDVNGFIEKLNSFRVEQFASDTETDLSSFALNEPFTGMEVILGSASGAEDINRIGLVKEKPYVYLKKPDSHKIVALPNSLSEYLKQGSLLFRKKSLMNVNSDQVKKLSVSSNNRTATYEQTRRSDESKTIQEWHITTPLQKKIEQASDLNSLMLEFCHMSASEFVADLNFSPDLTAYGLDKPEIIVTMEWSETDSQFSGKTIQIGKQTDDHYYARFSDDVIIFKVASGLVEAAHKLVEPPASPK